jgi:hypothetical protein
VQSKPWLVIFLCLLLAGCSATRLVYNQLDWGVVWYLNGFFSLEEEQEAELRDAVMRNLEWHRTTQLPKYARFCRELSEEFAGDVTVEMLESRYEEMLAFWDELVLHTVPDVAAFFALLNQEQIDDFLENLEDDNSELWDEYAGETPEARLERRERAAIKSTRRVIGRLDDQQEELIRSYMARMIDVAGEWMVGRRVWQAEFVSLIRERPPEPEFSERLTDLMLKPNQFDAPDYRKKVDANRRTVMAMAAELIGKMDDKQHARLNKRLMRYARDFEVLSVEGV